MLHEKVTKVQEDVKAGKKSNDQRTIFHDIIKNDQIRPEENTQERLETEGFGLISAG